MKISNLASFGIIPATLFIAACGDDVTKVTKIEETSGLEVVASADSLGKCSEEISGEMKFTTKENALYVCADSIWKNVSEAEKTVCSAETLSDNSGFKIVCDGDSIGVLKNGANGTDGEKGDAGKDGANGESCKLAEGPVLDAGSSQIRTSFVICGKDTVTLSDGRTGEACELADGGDGTVSVVCGETSTTLYKAFCGGKVYDPDLNSCLADSLVPLCGGKAYDLNESFCFADSIVSFCGGKTYDLDSSFCVENLIVPQSKKLVWDLMNSEVEYELFTDVRDGQVYRSVKIGEQVWMAENLNYAYNQKTSSLDSSSFCYNDEPDSCAKYGRLYLWSAAMDSATVFSEAGKGCGDEKTCASAGLAAMVQGVCPKGWHLPNPIEFEILVGAIGGTDFGIALKAISGWNDDGNGTDSFGFSALPAGAKDFGKNYDFNDAGECAFFWLSYESDKFYAQSMYQENGIEYSKTLYFDKDYGFSVRCIKD